MSLANSHEKVGKQMGTSVLQFLRAGCMTLQERYEIKRAQPVGIGGQKNGVDTAVAAFKKKDR